MGFNPFRPQRTTVADVAMVVITLVVTTALIVWAFLG